MAKAYKTQVTLKFRDGDPAKIMYFANIFSLAHDAFETFIVAAGYLWEEWFRKSNYLIPIRHTEADFKIPFIPGETYEIDVTVDRFGETSFKMKYVFLKNKQIHATVKMVHAVLDPKTVQKTPLPALMKSRLEVYYQPEKP